MTSEKTKPVILVDGSSYLFRAFHALPPLVSSKGEPTGAMYGVINMLRRLKLDYEPAYMAVIFDAKGKTFRHDWYAEYKANRPSMADELASQIAPLHQIIQWLGFPLICIEKVEADDVIGTLAKHAKESGLDVLISTGDKGMAQLVCDKVHLINTMSNEYLDESAVEKKYGVTPNQIVDYLALIGDKSDNVPGVDKVGPKTALKWLKQYGDLDGIIAHADEIKGKVGENLRSSLSFLPLSKKLVTIKCDVALECELDDLNLKSPAKDELIEAYTRFEFKTWLSELLSGQEDSEQKSNTKTNYEVVLSQADFDALVKRLEKASLFAFDTETTSLNYMAARLVGLSFSLEPQEAFYIPVGHDYDGVPSQLNLESALETLKPILENEQIKKVGHNLKYDMHVMSNYGVSVRGIEHDTLLESYVLNSTGSRHDLDTLALKYLGHKTIHFEDVAGKGAKQKTFDQVSIDEATDYAAEDADITLRLHQALWPQLSSSPALKSVYEDIEIPLLPVLAGMEYHGVLVCPDKLAQQSKRLEKRLAFLIEEAYSVAGSEFNLSSPKQLQEVLYERLELPIIKKTPKGQPSTAEDVLQVLAHDYPLPKIILEYRSLSKLKSTYTDKLPLQIASRTKRVHTSYHQAVTATGRLSSSDPNLQNIPIRTEEGRRIRQAFVAPDGYQLVAADYSQIELRIMAHLSGDQGLLEAFHKNLDIHSATAAEVFELDIEHVSAEYRRRAKAINFGLIYGMSGFGLAKQLGISREDAETYINIYFERYPGVKAYMERTKEMARKNGYVETIFGRRLYLPEINAQNKLRQQAALRAAINAPMQGSAADIIKRAMVRVQNWIEETPLDVTMTMQVHDELVFEVAASDVDAAKKEIETHMMKATKLDVDLVVDIGVGDTWDDAH